MDNLHRWLRVLVLSISAGIIVVVAIITMCNFIITSSTKTRLYSDINAVPERSVGLLLGTSKYAYGGRINLFYSHRITATVELYQAGKIRYVLVSGDNSVATYNEPDTMKADLIAAGIPEERIYVDYAGFDTLDSIIRARDVFLQSELIVISQSFHNQRAVYLASANQIDAIGYNAQDVPVSRSPRVWLRERLARVKAVWDVVTKAQPKFLGETIPIPAE